MTLTAHQKTLLTQLLHGEAWKVVMQLYVKRLAWLEAQMQQFGLDRDHSGMLLERRNELLAQVKGFYDAAEEASPLDAAAGALWATTTPRAEPVAEPPLSEEAAKFVRATRVRSGGGVA